MKPLFKFVTVLILLGLVLAACAQPTAAPVEPAPDTEAEAEAEKEAEPVEEEPAADTEKKVVGLVMKSLANEFFKVMQEATVAWADTEPGIELIPVGMNSETDIDTQFAAVENFVTQDVDLIVVAAADSVGMVAPVKKAVDA